MRASIYSQSSARDDVDVSSSDGDGDGDVRRLLAERERTFTVQCGRQPFLRAKPKRRRSLNKRPRETTKLERALAGRRVRGEGCVVRGVRIYHVLIWAQQFCFAADPTNQTTKRQSVKATELIFCCLPSTNFLPSFLFLLYLL